jgi:geranylgeranyl diphosphate synthase type II
VFGDPKTFGKQVGGDIIENKKTYLYLKAVEFSEPNKKTELQHLYSLNTTDHSEKINTAKQIFISSGSADATKKAIEKYTKKAFLVLEKLNISENNKLELITFGEQLMGRNM